MDNMNEDKNADKVILVDEETGEQLELTLFDGFEYKDQSYYVCVTDGDDENEDEPLEIIILREEKDEAGETYLVTLEEGEEDEVYDYYDTLLEDISEDED